MKNKIPLSEQHGQAIVEMCVCMIPILVVLLGMIFISGLGISNIRAFIEAKGNAELASRSGNAVGGEGNNIHHWDYGDSEGEDGLPFTADDRTVDFYDAGSTYGSETLMDLQLNMVQDSESLTDGDNSNYIFMPTSSLPYASENFAQNLPGTMLAAAELVKGTADSGFNNVFTLKENKHMSSDEIKSLNLSFTHLFGIEINKIDLRNMQANTVYYPALPNQ